MATKPKPPANPLTWREARRLAEESSTDARTVMALVRRERSLKVLTYSRVTKVLRANGLSHLIPRSERVLP